MRVDTAVDVDRDPAAVFAWIEDPDRAMRWQRDVRDYTIVSEGADVVGTVFTERVGQRGRGMRLRGEVTGYVPDESISFHLDSPIHRVDVTYSVTPRCPGARVTVASNIAWRFPMSVLARLLGARLRRAVVDQTERELDELKRLAEDGAA